MALFLYQRLLLIGTLLLARWVVTSKFGRVLTAIRDAEARAMFCGYNTVHYKTGDLHRLGGALRASPARSTCRRSASSTRARCRPPTRSRSRSGWRSAAAARLAGAILGAGLVNGAKSFFTVAFPEYWLFALGAIFIVVTLFMPRGVLGVLQRK
jgi:urea transport system permease protein